MIFGTFSLACNGVCHYQYHVIYSVSRGFTDIGCKILQKCCIFPRNKSDAFWGGSALYGCMQFGDGPFKHLWVCHAGK